MNDRDIRVGFLGFGSRGVSFIAPVLDNDIRNRVTTVIDPDVSRSKYFLDQAAAQGQIPRDEADGVRFVRDLSELREGEVDALFLTAYENVRAELFPLAVDTGAHLYMEKGISADLEGARNVVAAMERLKPGQKAFMGFNLRHYPPLVQAKRVIDEGRLGRLLYVQYTETLRFRHGSSFYTRLHRDVRNSGGMLVTKACHDFDMLGHLIGARPDRVFSAQYRQMFGKGGPEARERCHTCDRTLECDFDRMRRMGNRAMKRYYAKVYLDDDRASTDGYIPDICIWRDDTELRDLSHMLFEYENEVSATYSQALFSPRGNRVVKAFGDEGSLEFGEKDRSVIVTDRWGGQTETIVSSPVGDGHGGSDTGVIDAFFRCIRQDAEPVSTIADGVWALATAYAAYESRDTERWVKVRPIVQSVGSGLD